MAQQILFISTRRTHQVKECMDMCLYLNSNVLSLQAMSKQWKEDWNKDECLRPLFLVFSGFTFSFPIWQICRRCLVWDLNFHMTVQLYSLQTLAAECCTETHWWSSCSKLFCSDVSVNFSQNWIFHNIFVHQHWFANFIFPHRIAGGLWDWTFWSMAKPKHNHHNWI